MPWYHVQDASSGQEVLIEAESGSAAARTYIDEYPPDLMVWQASQKTVDEWRADGTDRGDPRPL